MPTPLLNTADVQAAAVTERLDEVKKVLISKMKTIAKRTDAVAKFKAAHDAKVAAFTAAIEAAATPEEIETAINSKDFSFNERYYPLYQD